MPDKKSDLLRITGLFTTKRKGMYTGTLRPEDRENLETLLGKAKGPVSLFLFRNDRDRVAGMMEYTLYAAESRPREESNRPPVESRSHTERQPIGSARRRSAGPEPERDDLPF